jgi:hypothetical protein
MVLGVLVLAWWRLECGVRFPDARTDHRHRHLPKLCDFDPDTLEGCQTLDYCVFDPSYLVHEAIIHLVQSIQPIYSLPIPLSSFTPHTTQRIEAQHKQLCQLTVALPNASLGHALQWQTPSPS